MNIIAKMAGIRPGNGIMRQYKNAKIRRNVAVGGALFDFGIAANNAKIKDGFGTIVMGGLTCLMMKLAKDNHYKIKQLKPHRNLIVARAKKIFAAKK